MNWNKLSCQKYVFEQNEYNSFPILELLDKFASQICHENTNTTLEGGYLADFGIDIRISVRLTFMLAVLWLGGRVMR